MAVGRNFYSWYNVTIYAYVLGIQICKSQFIIYFFAIYRLVYYTSLTSLVSQIYGFNSVISLAKHYIFVVFLASIFKIISVSDFIQGLDYQWSLNLGLIIPLGICLMSLHYSIIE